MNFLNDGKLHHLRTLVSRPDLSGTPYRIVQGIASGGMGDVYLVEDTRLQRQVAMKVMNAPDASEAQARLLEREARIIARLEHPGIIPIHDVGRLPDGRAWYTMMYVQGATLDNYLREVESLAEKLRLFLKICEALAFAHARGVLHRDLKPGNIMVGGYGAVLLMDWGIAAVLHNAEVPAESNGAETPAPHSGHTLTGFAAGTPAYMAPEQAAGAEQSPRSDVYALGAVLYFLLCGAAPPLPAGGGILPGLHRRRPRIPRRLAAICRKALHAAPAERYADAAQLADDLLRYLDNRPVSAYRENIIEKGLRLFARYRFVAVLLLAYLLTKIIMYFLARI